MIPDRSLEQQEQRKSKRNDNYRLLVKIILILAEGIAQW